MQSLFRYLFIIENILTVFMNGHKNERNIGTHHRLISRHVKCGSTNIYCMTLATLILCLIVISIRYIQLCTCAQQRHFYSFAKIITKMQNFVWQHILSNEYNFMI